MEIHDLNGQKVVVDMCPRHPLWPEHMVETNSGVLDLDTAYALELEELNAVANNATTVAGRALLHTRLYYPSTDISWIERRQDALREIRANDALRQAITDLVVDHAKNEQFPVAAYFGKYALDGIRADRARWQNEYDTIQSLRALVQTLPKVAARLPQADSEHLRGLQHDIAAIGGDQIARFAKGPIFRQWGKGVLAPNELSPYLPPLPFYPFACYPTYCATAFAIGSGMGYLMTNRSADGALALGAMTIMMGVPLAKMRMQDAFLSPIARRFHNNEVLAKAFSAIAQLDELLALDAYAKRMPAATLPRVYSALQHEIAARGILNPVQAATNPQYVPNDIVLDSQHRLTFLTGANSGGKTSLSKALVLNQILAQIGAYATADEFSCVPADRIFYQIGVNDRLGNNMGGFGTQLRVSRNILDGSSPRSFNVIDDLIDGTTFDEKLEQSADLMCGFRHVGANVVYVTHTWELAAKFAEAGVGRYLQVEFDGKRPTHKIISGISRYSHADSVAETLGMDAKSIEGRLQQKGYLGTGVSLRDLSAHGGKGLLKI